MTEQISTAEGTVEAKATPATEPVSMRQFLESVHPNVMSDVVDAWTQQRGHAGYSDYATLPDLRLHCPTCGGERTFRSKDSRFLSRKEPTTTNLHYKCGDCHNESKLYSLYYSLEDADEKRKSAKVYKYGELPPYGIPLPNRVLRLFGSDAELFKKGHRCETQGLGIAAFAYYRRVVENHKNDILDRIVQVCRTINAPEVMITEIEQAKAEVSFSKAIDAIKGGVPQALLIDGHNPLLALHGALSVGLHDESDAECLDAAQSVRIVLTELAERMATLRQDNKQLSEAVQKLIAKKK